MKFSLDGKDLFVMILENKNVFKKAKISQTIGCHLKNSNITVQYITVLTVVGMV